MGSWTTTARTAGVWSGLGAVLIVGAYILTGVVWLIAFGFQSHEPLEPTDPYLAILEALIVVLAPVMVVLMASVHAYAPQEWKTGTLVAFAFTTISAALTSSIHFLQLTSVRRLANQPGPDLAVLQLYPWPSPMLTLDLLAWDVFLGLALLFAAPAFRGGTLPSAVRVSMRLSGGLCLVGSLGPILGDMRIQYLGIVGYAAVFPVVCGLLALLFRRTEAATHPALPPMGSAIQAPRDST